MGTMTPTFRDFINGLVSVSPQTPLPVTNSLFQIQLGNVDGFQLLNIAGEKHNVDTQWQDVSEVDGVQELPTEGNPEEWEALSTSPEDSIGGSGTSSILIPRLGDGWTELDPVVASVNGTSPTIIPGGAINFRALQGIVLNPDGGSNVGDIIIRVAGGGPERLRIKAFEGASKSSLFSVPVGKTAFAQFIIAASGKNQDTNLRSWAQTDGGPVITGGTIPDYQGNIAWPVIAPFTLPQKTDLRLQVRSTNESTEESPIEVTTFFDFLIVDNNKIASPVNSMRNGF